MRAALLTLVFFSFLSTWAFGQEKIQWSFDYLAFPSSIQISAKIENGWHLDLYFRTETQTTVGIGGDICLFFVKVNMHPLQQVWEDLSKRQWILESINSMSEAVLDYKNLGIIKEIVNE